MAELPSGAVLSKPSLLSRFKMWLHGHQDDAKKSLRDLLVTPFNSLLTFLVIGVALALPTTLHVALKYGQQVAGSFEGSSQITLYLKDSTTEAAAQTLVDKLKRDDQIASAQYQSREQSLAEFKQLSGFGDALDYLDENPLPAVVIVQPALGIKDAEQVELLVSRLNVLSEVQEAQLDLAWLRRLQALMQVGERVASALALLLGLAVILIIGNTIRLAIQNRRAEIEVIKLVGATDAFIRRPFLYSGLWYGLFGGVLAWVLVSVALWWLDDPVNQLAGLYQSQYRVIGLSFGEVLKVIAFATVLGLGGSWLSVTRHLREIEPR
ncbi:MAG TPA: permease-like cell division protein FtsX [Permianibacter sp.]|nr:permease-like cell division protein FtsX [Permianibacter sp.]